MWSWLRLCIVGLILRLALIAYSVWHDAHHVLKYTDIDYVVFSDAAHFLATPSRYNRAQGPLGRHLQLGDPYKRETYRYTPLLALALTPNEFVHPLFGKCLFSIADIFVSVLLCRLLKLKRVSEARTKWIVCMVWLFNPMIINISTRGSSESLLGLLVLSCLHAAEQKQWNKAAVLIGLATHCKIYPFIYGASCVTALIDTSKLHSTPFGASLNSRTVQFFLIAFTSFMSLNSLMYSIWGKPFVEEAFLYHFSRLDAAHNFSPAFYPIQLSALSQSIFTSFVPQLIISLGLGLMYAQRDLAFAWFLQTMAFVTFNRVCTSQYFLWYLWLLPFAIARTKMSGSRAFALLSIWVAAQAIWLKLAYNLEFLHQPVQSQVWLASLGFQIVNVYILGQLILNFA